MTTTPPRRRCGAGLFISLRGNDASAAGAALGRSRARDIAFPLVSSKVFRKGVFVGRCFLIESVMANLEKSHCRTKKQNQRCFSPRPRRAWRSQQRRSPPLPPPPRGRRTPQDVGSPAAGRLEEPRRRRPRRREGASAPALSQSASALLLPASLAGPPPRPRAPTSRM